MSLQRFDFNQAESLKNTLQNEANKLSEDLNRMMQKVEGVRNWWQGGSEEAFIENFRNTKEQIVRSLNQVIEDYKMLIEKIKQAKQEAESSIAQQIRG